MTRINTNVSSLIAQTNLARTNNQLSQSLTRLSTGLRINSGKDDPAGLIASTMLGSDIVSTQKAISNSQQANQMLSTADSALGQVSTLLDTIRGLVDESANTGSMSADQTSANQLQIDASLAAINQIAQSTKFQGQNLLSGGLDFVTSANAAPQVQSLQVSQATLASNGQLGVNVNVTKAATQATVQSATGKAAAVAKLSFAPRTTVSFTSATTAELNITALTTGPQMEGVKITASAGATTAATYDPTSKTLALTVAAGAKPSDIAGVINGDPVLSQLFSAAAVTGDDAVITGSILSGDTLKAPSLKFTANTAGTDMNGFKVNVQDGTAVAAQWSQSAKTLTITINNAADTNLGALTTALNGLSTISGAFTVTNTADGSGAATTAIYSSSQTALEDQAQATDGITGYLHSGFSAATQAMATLNFAPAVAASLATSGTGSTLDIESKSLDSSGAGVLVSFINDNTVTAGAEFASYDATAKTLDVHYSGGNSSVGQVAAAINKLDGWTATSEDTTTDTDTVNATGQTAVKTVVDQLQVASLNAGADYNNAQVKMLAVAGLTGGPKAIWDNNKKTMTIEVATDDTTTADLTTLAQIKAAVEALPGFTANAVIPQNGLGQIYALQADANATANTGNSGGNTLLSDTVMQLGGTSGSQSFNFSAGTSVNDIANAINLVSDSTGVTASQSDGLLTINSAAYGSKQYAAVSVTSEGIAGTLKNSLSSTRATGTDAQATINGTTAVADGNNLGVSSSTLNLNLQVAANQTGAFSFAIQGGGALFQLGPDIVSTQQARLGIQGVNSTQLGGSDGTLDQLASGQKASLANNVALASKIVAEATTQVTTLRGRFGAFQQAALDSNVAALSDTVNSLTDAQSSIQDVDFAAETASLQRAQILSQSGMSVLGIANSQPQNVLTLLRNL